MSGEAYKRIVEAATEAAKVKMDMLNQIMQPDPVNPGYYGCLSDDQKTITLSSGRVVRAIVKGVPQKCGPVFPAGPGVFVAQGPAPKCITIDGQIKTGYVILSNG